MSSTQIFKLYQYIYNSRKHLLEMLEDRGYNVDHLKEYTEDEIKIMLNEHYNGKFNLLPDIGPLDIILEKTKLINDNYEKEKIYIKYRLDDKFKGTSSLNSQINEIYENILNIKDTLIILNISRVLMKIGVKDKNDEEQHLFITKNYFVQLFGLENFLFNVSRHQFVPKHRILSKQETIDFLAKFNITLKNIPTIKRDDPQAKYIGLRPKQICEITAENITSGTTKRYRVCTN
jgi:DNA-directed RNA polymerase subunit H (RpoH/RPB5)